MRKFLAAFAVIPTLTISLTAQAQQPPPAGTAQQGQAQAAQAAQGRGGGRVQQTPEQREIGGGAPAPQASAAPGANPRFGKWRLKPTDPAAPPSTNVMTYEPYERTGMKVTINQLQADGTLTPQWGYTTMFDNKETAMTGSRSTQMAAVRMISDRTAEITYRRDGRITQQLTNVLSPDGNTIGIIYMNYGADGKPDTVTFATYERMK